MAKIAKNTTTPAHMTTLSLYCGAQQRISQKTSQQAAQPISRPPHQQSGRITPAVPLSQMGQSKAPHTHGFQTRKQNRSPKLESVSVRGIIPARAPMHCPTPRHNRNSEATQCTWPDHRPGRHQPSNHPDMGELQQSIISNQHP